MVSTAIAKPICSVFSVSWIIFGGAAHSLLGKSYARVSAVTRVDRVAERLSHQ
jgi:hypothetical protein